jgi:hypothetical protein
MGKPSGLAEPRTDSLRSITLVADTVRSFITELHE